METLSKQFLAASRAHPTGLRDRDNLLVSVRSTWRTNSYAYDAANRLTTITQAVGFRWPMGYDGRGKDTTIKDPSAHVRKSAGRAQWHPALPCSVLSRTNARVTCRTSLINDKCKRLGVGPNDECG